MQKRKGPTIVGPEKWASAVAPAQMIIVFYEAEAYAFFSITMRIVSTTCSQASAVFSNESSVLAKASDIQRFSNPSLTMAVSSF